MKKIILFLITLIPIFVSAQKNLIKNGGFEMEFNNWRGDVAIINPFEKKAGNKSCAINQYIGAEWKGMDQIAIVPKKTYAIEFSAWVKTDAIEGGKNDYNVGIVTAEFLNAGDNKITSESIAQVKGSTPWTLYKKTVLVPEKAKKIRTMLALAQTNGTILFDNVIAITISEDDYLENTKKEVLKNQPEIIVETSSPETLLNGSFQEGLSNWNGSGKIIQDLGNKENYYASITSSIPLWTAIEQSAEVPNNAKTIEFSGLLKAEDITQGKNEWNKGSFIVELTKDGTTKTIEDQTIGSLNGTTDWTYFKKTINIPEGTTKYRVMLALSNCTGTLLTDEIKVEFTNK